MFSHATVGSADIARSKRFYDAALAPLAIEAKRDGRGFVGYGRRDDRRAQFYVTKPFDRAPMSAGNGAMVAFDAGARAMVDAFHAAALAAGGRDEGAPGLRAQYHPDFYAAYVRDPDGNKLCCVCHLPE